MTKVYFIDHYDSFSFNLIDWLRSLGGIEIERVLHDDPVSLQKILVNPAPFVISPGPKSPREAVGTVTLVQKLWTKVPILGVCLGHQILAFAWQAEVVPASDPHHGATRTITVDDSIIFKHMPNTFKGASYNSLTVDAKSLDTRFRVVARCDQGEVQAIETEHHVGYPAFGLQYHPESFLSENQETVLRNWLSVVRTF